MSDKMDFHKELLRRVCEQLEVQTGLHSEWNQDWESVPGGRQAGAILTIRSDQGAEHLFAVEVKPLLTAQTIHLATTVACRNAARMRMLPLIVSEYVNPSLAEQLRRENVNYADLAGNTYLRAPNLHVDIQRRSNVSKPSPRRLNAKALQLVGSLLVDPRIINETSRKLSQRANIALGSASTAMRQLEEQGFAIHTGKDQRELRHPGRLFELWLQGYADVLRPKLARRTCRLNPAIKLESLHTALADAGVSDVLVGGEAAAAFYTNYLTPSRAVLHTFADVVFPPELLLPDTGGNVDVLVMFGDLYTWSGGRLSLDAHAFAHPILVCAELLAVTGSDRRIAQTAAKLRAKFQLDEELQQNE